MAGNILSWIGVGIGSGGLGLSIYNTARQARRDRPRFLITCEGGLSQRARDGDNPASMHVRIANAGYRPAQVTAVRFRIDPAVLGVGRNATLALLQLEPSVELPRLIEENESVLLEYALEQFDPSRGLARVEVEDGLGKLHHADAPAYRRQGG